ncbi:MAG: roadblock/LC7 domain-containing protein [Candidatus Thorarchaeota archaeon]
MALSNNPSRKSETGLRQVLTDIVNSLEGIYSGFCVDTDGLLIEEINLEATLGKESSLILCSLVAGIQSSMDTIGREIRSSPWVSFTAESSNYKFFLRAIGSFAFLGVLTDPYVDLELLKLIIGPAVDSIIQIIQQWTPLKRPQSQFSPLAISQRDLDEILTKKK